MALSLNWSCCLSPKVVQIAITKIRYSILDGGRFVFEFPLPWRKKESQFGGGKSFRPEVDVVGVAKDGTPARVKERRQFSSSRYGTVTEEDDFLFKKLIDVEWQREIG